MCVVLFGKGESVCCYYFFMLECVGGGCECVRRVVLLCLFVFVFLCCFESESGDIVS